MAVKKVLLENKNTVLTIQNKNQILKKYEDGTKSVTSLAKKYGIGIQTLCEFVKGKAKLRSLASKADSSTFIAS